MFGGSDQAGRSLDVNQASITFPTVVGHVVVIIIIIIDQVARVFVAGGVAVLQTIVFL